MMTEEQRQNRREYIRKWHATHPERRGEYNRKKLLVFYGLTPDSYDAMSKGQGGVCAICGYANESGERLSVDHDHETGRVRGLLCRNCNASLGNAHDDIVILARMIEYLTRGG